MHLPLIIFWHADVHICRLLDIIDVLLMYASAAEKPHNDSDCWQPAHWTSRSYTFAQSYLDMLQAVTARMSGASQDSVYLLLLHLGVVARGCGGSGSCNMRVHTLQ